MNTEYHEVLQPSFTCIFSSIVLRAYQYVPFTSLSMSMCVEVTEGTIFGEAASAASPHSQFPFVHLLVFTCQAASTV